MPVKNGAEWVWLSGEVVPWQDANVHVSVHALHYGTSVFEGIRAYKTEQGPAIFRLQDHMKRFMFTCKVMRLTDTMTWTQEELEAACVDLVHRNAHDACYIRPLAFRDSETFGLNGANQPVQVAILTVPWGRYLGEKGIEEGVDVVVSSWRRVASSPMAKIGGQYVNNQQVSMEARRHGYTEGITLDPYGYVAEGAGENIFLVINGELYTPPLAAHILSGITRDTVVKIAHELELPIREEYIARDMLYAADEIFMTGTAAEITPLRSVDGLPVGNGGRGPITRAIQDVFFDTVAAKRPDSHGWLTFVNQSHGKEE